MAVVQSNTPKRIKFEFNNTSGEKLVGLLETPNDLEIKEYAVFAHCFTCGKDIAAASRISRALTKHGIAVLRFDFTGLGNSDGDFSNTNFSSNVQDLLDAAREVEKRYKAPALLVGHSLGGAAVLSAASQLPSIKALATIGSPATAEHVKHLFHSVEGEIKAEGQAGVRIGARQFTIKEQLLDDLAKYADIDHIGGLAVPLAVFHSPIDTIVSIDEAAKIYQAAKHPKSFISLDKADHLLTKKEDSEYVATTLAAWASRYLDIELTEELVAKPATGLSDLEEGKVRITEQDKTFLRGLYTASHELLADEPKSHGGKNLGPNPYDLLLMSLGACTSMTLRMYANHKKWPLIDVNIDLKHEKVHVTDCEDCDKDANKIDRITRIITIKGDLCDDQRARLLEIADRCPVHRTLENNPVIETKLV